MSNPFVRHQRLCEGLGEDPYLHIVKLYISYLKGLFNFLPSGNFHWEPDNEETEIVIRGESPLNTETVGKKPAITVSMGPTSWAGIGINNLLSKNNTTQEEVRTDLITGHLMVYCLSNSDTIAMRLAHIVAHHTRVQQRLLESEGGFHAIARPFPTINSPSPPGSLVSGDPEGLVMVQTNIPFQFQFSWSTIPRQDRRLRGLHLIPENNGRASDFPYTSPARLERVQLAISTSPVLVRRIGGSNAGRPSTVTVRSGISPFQISGLRPFGDEE